MLRPMRRTLLLALLAACGQGAPAPAPAAAAPVEAAKPAAPAPAAAPTAAPAKRATTAEPPLTQAELDLIAADPEHLTPEKRRERAFALRRKIMQNPDSPAARQLEEIRLAVEAGELHPALPGQPPPPPLLSSPADAPEAKAP